MKLFKRVEDVKVSTPSNAYSKPVEYEPAARTQKQKEYIPKVDTEKWKEYVPKLDPNKWKEYVPKVDIEKWKQSIPKFDPDKWKEYLSEFGKYNPKGKLRISLPIVKDFNLFNMAEITAPGGLTMRVKLPFPLNEKLINKIGGHLKSAGGNVELENNAGG